MKTPHDLCMDFSEKKSGVCKFLPMENSSMSLLPPSMVLCSGASLCRSVADFPSKSIVVFMSRVLMVAVVCLVRSREFLSFSKSHIFQNSFSFVGRFPLGACCPKDAAFFQCIEKGPCVDCGFLPMCTNCLKDVAISSIVACLSQRRTLVCERWWDKYKQCTTSFFSLLWEPNRNQSNKVTRIHPINKYMNTNNF